MSTATKEIRRERAMKFLAKARRIGVFKLLARMMLVEGREFGRELEAGCPVAGCGCECVHPTVVEVNAGGSITTIDYDGTRMSAGEASGRGVHIRLGFVCEWGHSFSVGFQFHKGQTSVELDDGGAVPEKTIWRD